MGGEAGGRDVCQCCCHAKVPRGDLHGPNHVIGLNGIFTIAKRNGVPVKICPRTRPVKSVGGGGYDWQRQPSDGREGEVIYGLNGCISIFCRDRESRSGEVKSAVVVRGDGAVAVPGVGEVGVGGAHTYQTPPRFVPSVVGGNDRASVGDIGIREAGGAVAFKIESAP